MPQMSPMMWSYLYLYFIILIIIIMVMLFNIYKINLINNFKLNFKLKKLFFYNKW